MTESLLLKGKQLQLQPTENYGKILCQLIYHVQNFKKLKSFDMESYVKECLDLCRFTTF